MHSAATAASLEHWFILILINPFLTRPV